MENPKLSTMVVLYTLNLKLNTTKILEDLPLDSEIIKVEKRGILTRGKSSRDNIKRRSKKDKISTTGFGRNSITIVSMNDGNGTLPKKEITTKIFQNGVFHMTGILDPRYDSSTLDYLISKIWIHCKDSLIDPPEKWEIMKRRVVLMNYTSQINPLTTIHRENLSNKIKTSGDDNVICSYDPDVYPGVKIQFKDRKWTSKVFRTGKLILTGIISNEECQEFQIRMCSLLKNCLPIK